MTLEKPVEQYDSVVRWKSGLAEQWGGDPLAEEPEKLETLRAFCEFIAKDPDALVGFCFLRRKQTGERFGSVKRREEVIEKLKEFRSRSGLTGTKARKLTSNVLSFLIHNGVLVSAGML
jgi:hypothetical protein